MSNFRALSNEILARVIGFLDKKSLAEVRLVNKGLKQILDEHLFARITLYAHWKKSVDAAANGWEHEADADADAVRVHGNDQLLEEDELFSDDLGLLEDADGRLHLDGSEHTKLEEEEGLEWDGRPTFRILTSTTQIPQWDFDGFIGSLEYDARMFKNILLVATLNQYEVQIYTCYTDCDFHPARARRWYGGDMPGLEFGPTYLECVERLGEFPALRKITIHFDRHATGGYSSYRESCNTARFSNDG